MQAIKQILLPGEQVLFAGKVHPVVYIHSVAYLILAYGVWRYGATIVNIWPWVAGWAANAAYHLPPLQHARRALYIVLAVFGSVKLIQAYLLSSSTELAVTSHRVIAKLGIATTIMLEMDRRKIAGVVVVQSMLGQWLDYGQVWIRGFSGDIHGLPPIARPAKLQAEINRQL